MILSAYQYKIEFRPTDDCNADRLSHLPLTGIPPDVNSDPKIFNISQMEALPVSVHQLQATTASDGMLSKVFQYTKPHRIPQPFFERRNELTVEEGCLP